MNRPYADATAATTPPPVRRGAMALRATMADDCGFVVDVERHPDNAGHVEQWSEAQHRAALTLPGIRHWIIEHRDTPVGYVVLEDADDPNGSVLLRRIAIVSKGRGHGRSAVLLAAHYCFDVLGCHRLWLNVARDNRRAFNLYRRLGFVEEGIARESVRKGDRFLSMHVLSLLDREYRANHQL